MKVDPRVLVETYAQALDPTGKPDYFALHRRRYVALLEALAAPTGSSVLEIGCNPGQFTELLVRAGYQVSGLDLHPQDRQGLWERLGIEVRRCNLESDDLPYPADSFEAAVFSEVMEHLPGSPLPALEEIHRVLRPGGVLVLSTPNARSLRERLLVGLRLLFWRSLEPPADFHRRMRLRGEEAYTIHHRVYTAEEVRWLLEQAGFVGVQVRYLAAREAVGVTWGRALRRPWRVLPKALLWGVGAIVPPVRSMLLGEAYKRDR